jgi:hypothetical protein
VIRGYVMRFQIVLEYDAEATERRPRS